MSKYTKTSLIECTCCRMLRHENEVVHLGDMPTVHICIKCLKEDLEKESVANEQNVD